MSIAPRPPDSNIRPILRRIMPPIPRTENTTPIARASHPAKVCNFSLHGPVRIFLTLRLGSKSSGEMFNLLAARQPEQVGRGLARPTSQMRAARSDTILHGGKMTSIVRLPWSMRPPWHYAYTVMLHYSFYTAVSMEKPNVYSRLLPPRGDTFELKYSLKTSPYRVGYEFGSRPKAEGLPIHDTVYLSDELFRESDIEIV